MAESAPQLPENDIEAVAQQPVQDENTPADGDKRSSSDYEQRLYRCVEEYLKNFIPMDVPFLNFHGLSQMNILHLMNELSKYDQAMRKDKAAPQDIEHVGDLLHRYTTAVHDLGYWSKLPKYGEPWGRVIYRNFYSSFLGVYGDREKLEMAHLGKEPKSTSGSVDPLRSFLNRVLPRHLTLTDEEKFKFRNTEGRLLLGRDPEGISPFVDTLARFIVAITGGLSLVIPMLVMRLGETLPKSLTTVSVAVLLFSALTSLMFKASNVETLGATAAYAAVLVVFVGTSS